MIDGDMEKLREIYVFVCFALGVVALILCVFQAWNGKIGSASALGGAFVVCGVFLFLSQIKTFKVWEVQVELRETLDRAEEIIGRVRKLCVYQCARKLPDDRVGKSDGDTPREGKASNT